MILRFPISMLLLAGLSACGPKYSPDTYSTNAVQQANKVDQGVIVGVRQVDISATGATGTVTGAAAGGIAGAQVGSGPVAALSALGGSLVGGIAGSAVEHATVDTTAYEYVVQKKSGELVSVTQKDKTPLAVGLHVLVIAGNQARIVPDYTLAADPAPKHDAPKADGAKPDAGKPDAGKPDEAKPATSKPDGAKPAATDSTLGDAVKASAPGGTSSGTSSGTSGATSGSTDPIKTSEDKSVSSTAAAAATAAAGAALAAQGDASAATKAAADAAAASVAAPLPSSVDTVVKSLQSQPSGATANEPVVLTPAIPVETKPGS
ncbi:hypothetical protein [Rhodopila sp.]|uniref:outer membrane lipoprotein n=1 Tax=Rhodopila sp. TaxID=2480087 RepID=UPI002BCA9E87|nr:hypothetical protein [Rhodopila sp.]HVZ09112.1 hypothetical protein [Rhodopila sp.]